MTEKPVPQGSIARRMARIHGRLGTAGLIVSVLALVAALAGSAIAAAGLTSKQKREVKTIVTAEIKRHPSPAGAQGPPGPQGPAGAPGAPGADGVSPTGTEFSGKAHGCEEGGVEFKGSNTTFACNGVKGEPGPLVSALPSGETLKGLWGGGASGELKQIVAPISFQFPVEPAPVLVYIKNSGAWAMEIDPTKPALEGGIAVLESEEAIEGLCPGSAAAPTAEPGYLCAYTEKEESAELSFENVLPPGEWGKPTSYGATLPFSVSATKERGLARGTWAVRAQ